MDNRDSTSHHEGFDGSHDYDDGELSYEFERNRVFDDQRENDDDDGFNESHPPEHDDASAPSSETDDSRQELDLGEGSFDTEEETGFEEELGEDGSFDSLEEEPVDGSFDSDDDSSHSEEHASGSLAPSPADGEDLSLGTESEAPAALTSDDAALYSEAPPSSPQEDGSAAPSNRLPCHFVGSVGRGLVVHASIPSAEPLDGAFLLAFDKRSKTRCCFPLEVTDTFLGRSQVRAEIRADALELYSSRTESNWELRAVWFQADGTRKVQALEAPLLADPLPYLRPPARTHSRFLLARIQGGRLAAWLATPSIYLRRLLAGSAEVNAIGWDEGAFSAELRVRLGHMPPRESRLWHPWQLSLQSRKTKRRHLIPLTDVEVVPQEGNHAAEVVRIRVAKSELALLPLQQLDRWDASLRITIPEGTQEIPLRSAARGKSTRLSRFLERAPVAEAFQLLPYYTTKKQLCFFAGHDIACDSEIWRAQNYLTKVKADAAGIHLEGVVHPDAAEFCHGTIEVSLRKNHTDLVATATAVSTPIERRRGLFAPKEAPTETRFRVTIDPQALGMGPGRWAAYLRVHHHGRTLEARLGSKRQGIADEYNYVDTGCTPTEDGSLIAFTRFNASGQCDVVVRPRSPYDAPSFQRVQRLALAANELLPPSWEADTWLITEKLGETAQDNSFHFFRYCYEKHPERRVFYVMTRDSPQRGALAGMEDRVVDFYSMKHFLLLLRARVLVSSETRSHFLQAEALPGPFNRVLRDKHLVFLQHGVLALKNVSGIYRRGSGNRVNRFVVSSRKEAEIVTRHFGYPRSEVLVTGLARWDALEDRSGDRGGILVMPTWRNWLHTVDDEEFLGSDFFLRYREFLCSDELADLLERLDTSLTFYIHTYLEKYLPHFSCMSPRIRIVRPGEENVNDLLMRHRLLITDYSSVAWDFLKLNKPTVFFHFDEETYLKRQGSYIDFESELVGPRAHTTEQLMELVKASASEDFKLSELYTARRADWFAFDDRENCSRIFGAITRYEKELRRNAKLVNRMDRTRRKLNKLRRSPTRFAADSWLVRRLKAL